MSLTKRRPSIFDNRNYLLLWTGNVASNVGFEGIRIAYPLVGLMLTGSPVMAGCATFSATLPAMLFGVPAGIVADLGDRYRVLLACQRIGLVATIAAAAATIFRVPWLWELLFLAAAFAESTAQTFFSIAEMAFVRTIVDEEERPTAYALFNVETRIARMVGRAIAGTATVIARSMPFLANAVSYVYCLWTLLAIRRTADTRPRKHKKNRTRLVQWNHPGASLQVILAERFLWGITAIIAAMNAMASITQLQIILEIRSADRSPVVVGIVLGGFGVGGVLGSLVAGRLANRYGAVDILTWSLWAWTLLLLPVALNAEPIVLGLCWAGMGIITATSVLAVNLCYLRLIPDHLLGRAESAVGFLLVTGSAAGALPSGVVASMVGPTTTVWIVAAGAAASAMWARRLREPSAINPQPTRIRPRDRRLARAVDHAERWTTRVVDFTGPIVAKVADYNPFRAPSTDTRTSTRKSKPTTGNVPTDE